ncbi:LytR/AlgR family response regulator transcription factor [Membranihabitans marinus]|uniref:LytR/AlgR family response regulator transcription factor n=1 Tax=Membranihabitans marinus TaxID=1227546 RepID=UPI001F466727|nr:LytTR family DNA-binding domain-containing protein [Membranihabitans marinus]
MIIEISIIGFFQSLLKTFMFLNGQYEIKTLLECVKIAFIILPFSMFITYFILHYFFQPRPSLPKPTIQPLKPKDKRIIFKDDQQTTKLIVDENNLLYVQSQDNYIAVHYLLDKIVKKKLIRNTLKNISKDIGEGILIKVHRSYLVNISQLSSFQKEGKKHWIYLNSLPNDPIPVSSTYIKAVEEKLS